MGSGCGCGQPAPVEAGAVAGLSGCRELMAVLPATADTTPRAVLFTAGMTHVCPGVPVK